MALTAGSNLGPYRIIEPIGRGGMASVFKAYEASLDRYIALKVLPPEFMHDPTFAERFTREAQTVARLEHPQIIPIYAYGIDTATGTPWMAMRLIAGGSLSQRIKRGRVAPAESARILKEVADALDYAHGAGVIHRDVKPQNVLLDESGRVYLADFGIAKMIEGSAHITQTGMITGTPQYMAPEQALGRPIDKTIDIYALGIVAYELFTGRVPFMADTPVAVLMKQANEPMPLPPVSEVQEEVTRAILRATAKDPASRWPSASAFARALSTATTSVGSIGATSVMAAIPAGAAHPTMAQHPTQVGATQVGATQAGATQAGATPVPVSSTRRGGAGVGVALSILLLIALVGAGVIYGGYRYLNSSNAETAVVSVPQVQTPVVPVAAPSPTITAAETPVVETTPAPLPRASKPVSPPVAAPTPVTRKAVAEGQSPSRPVTAPTTNSLSSAPPDRTEERPVAPVRAPRTRIRLEVEATQPSTGSQIGALYAQVQIDNRPYHDFTIRFMGANSFARWKKVENIVIDDVPLNAREITVIVATDPSLDQERMEGSTRLALRGEENNLEVVVRFFNQFDKTVRFR